MRAKNKLVKRVSSEFYLLFSLSRYLFFVTSLVYILSFFHSSSFSLSFDFCLLASCVVCAEFKEFIASFYILEHIFLNINFALCVLILVYFFLLKIDLVYICKVILLLALLTHTFLFLVL